MRTPQRRRLVTAAAAIGGAVLFVSAVGQVGVAEIAAGLRRVGWGFLLILALAGIRFLLRAEAWRLCMPPHTRLSYGQTLRAFLAGDAVGNVTPLGMLASEPAKAFLVSHRLATRESVASLALDNIVYAASIAATVAVGLVVLVATVPLPRAWQLAAAAALAALGVGSVAALRLLRTGAWEDGRGDRPAWRARVAAIREAVAHSASDPLRLWRVAACDAAFHVVAVLEVFVTLRWLIGDGSVTIAQAIVFEALNRVVTAVFKVVPFRVGVDEASSGALAPLLGLPLAVGVTLAVVRKVRNLCWTAVGLLWAVGGRRP